MKKILFLLCLPLFTLSTTAQTTSTDESMIRDLIINSFQEILSENQQDKLPEYYTDDFLLLEDGEVWDLKIIKSYMDKAAEMERMPQRINSFEFVEIKILGDMAWTAYHNKAVFKMDGREVGEMNWLESATAIRTAEGWKLQMLHSTVVEEKEAQKE